MLNLFYRRITTEDLADAPKGNWKEKLLYALNLFFQQVYSLLNGNLTPEVNMICQTQSFQIVGSATTADNTYSFATKYSYFPLGYDLLSVQPIDNSTPIFTAAPYVSWTYINSTFQVLGISGLTTGVRYQITIRVWWGAIQN